MITVWSNSLNLCLVFTQDFVSVDTGKNNSLKDYQSYKKITIDFYLGYKKFT